MSWKYSKTLQTKYYSSGERITVKGILRGGEQCCDLRSDAGEKRAEGHVRTPKPVPEG